MNMTRFGGNEFMGFSVPLVFGGRYFVLEPGNPPLLSVFLEVDGQVVFEVLKNKPISNLQSDVSSTGAGIVAVSDKKTKRFLYKIRPTSTTSVVFGKLDGSEINVQITDKNIHVGTNVFENNTFDGMKAGLVIHENGDIIVGTNLPPVVVALLKPKN
jgi:hypothetical protein